MLICLAMGEVLCDGFNFAVSSPSDRRGSEARICIIAIKDKTEGLIHISRVFFVYIMSSYFRFILVEFSLSTSCHHTSCITLFVMSLIPREASIEPLLKWSNSSRCRIISVYLSRMWCLYTVIISMNNIIIIRFSINCPTVICSRTIYFLFLRERSLKWNLWTPVLPLSYLLKL
jgi:hypothetical protein